LSTAIPERAEITSISGSEMATFVSHLRSKLQISCTAIMQYKDVDGPAGKICQGSVKIVHINVPAEACGAGVPSLQLPRIENLSSASDQYEFVFGKGCVGEILKQLRPQTDLEHGKEGVVLLHLTSVDVNHTKPAGHAYWRITLNITED